jgi:hypothetical protein
MLPVVDARPAPSNEGIRRAVNDIIDGGNTNDRLFGNDGRDACFGGNNADTIDATFGESVSERDTMDRG